ncbi:MAG: hypothetical protein QGF87_08835 [Woeseiaceae bacterium]|nr:hypothetical protein [Woeseiaceae bacterium]
MHADILVLSTPDLESGWLITGIVFSIEATFVPGPLWLHGNNQ